MKSSFETPTTIAPALQILFRRDSADVFHPGREKREGPYIPYIFSRPGFLSQGAIGFEHQLPLFVAQR